MMISERSTEFYTRSRFYHNCLTAGLSVTTIVVFAVAAIFTFLPLIDTSFVQIDNAHKPISSVLFFSDSAIEEHCLPRFYGYHIALWYDFGNWLGQFLV